MDIYNKTQDEEDANGKVIKDGKQIFLMVYCAGHGVSDQQQYMVMNQNEGKHCLVGVEMKLRSLADVCNGKCGILAIYDMCRTDKAKFPELTSRGVMDVIDEFDPLVNASARYFQLSGAAPKKTV